MSSKSRRKFTPEFKSEAVEMVKAADGNIAQVARERGSTIRRWGTGSVRPEPRPTAPPLRWSGPRSAT
jgi:hypothetical protein